MSVILVVAAHPDDEILGVGATIARRVSEGEQAYALILGEGQTSRWEDRAKVNRTIISDLHNDSFAAAEIIGYKDIYFEDIPDNRFDSVDLLNIIKIVERYVDELRPDIIYTHHAHDLNIDHRITFEAVLTATRPFGECPVKEVYGFETASSTEWNFGNKEEVFYPNVFIDIEDFFERKCEAMKCYRSELREFPHPRSLKMLELTAQRWEAF